MRRTVAVVIAMLIAIGGFWLVRAVDQTESPDAAPPPRTPAPVEPASPTPTPSPTPTEPPGDSCDQVARAFAPRTITVPGVTRNAFVVAPPRDANGVPGVPPLDGAGKAVFAWDREQGIRPGDPKGNVLLNAHTWPDGSALGNHLLAGLRTGDRILVHGDKARLCYRVTERVEVLAEKGLPRYYRKKGPPQLAIVVCSGRRLGPGLWEKRTVWFASPSV